MAKNNTQSVQVSDLQSAQVRNKAYERPLLVTKNGTPEFVFMSLSQYEKLTRGKKG